ncbi:MAG: hypothetical protein ABEJ04_04865 [Halobacteriaceae archaeon]
MAPQVLGLGRRRLVGLLGELEGDLRPARGVGQRPLPDEFVA